MKTIQIFIHRLTVIALTGTMLLGLLTPAYAQQFPDYSLYNNNHQLINPAYTGTRGNMSFTAGYRKQWAGVNGAPTTLSFAGQAYLPKFRVGLGLSGWQYTAGAVKQTAVYTAYSYRLDFEKFKLNFGLQAGFLNNRTNYAGANLNGIIDPAFANDVNETNFNLGTGVMLYNDTYYVGFSAPVLLTYEGDANSQIKMSQEFVLTGGYLFSLTPEITLKPNAFVKFQSSSPTTYNLAANAYYNKKFGFGMMYKSQKTLAFLADLILDESFYIGYAYDIPGGADISADISGSHEFCITYVLKSKAGEKAPVRLY